MLCAEGWRSSSARGCRRCSPRPGRTSSDTGHCTPSGRNSSDAGRNSSNTGHCTGALLEVALLHSPERPPNVLGDVLLSGLPGCVHCHSHSGTHVGLAKACAFDHTFSQSNGVGAGARKSRLNPMFLHPPVLADLGAAAWQMHFPKTLARCKDTANPQTCG